ncbi:mandelate racemase/muconate lactonizing enzyme family protein [Chelativorans sp. AA-79]|uniref:mandelate racemase/muconate lactonizing enzyme family protein n=1 Tax=Chelativorans sp. AA-79 TaxID=3028735 RepID=UPI0023F95D37|nr:mandelate racemase/muconate lactonizing enzyme family protein [Chelativorans sp. AA-79]WEX09826.1 mandelate racemase/muconate lactonizing enzyme family protein [Chelativorans sp. AA-79]
MDISFETAEITPHVFRVPIDVPVVTSFGEMRDRPALFVQVRSSDGAEGWGEVWCNFPSVGAEHRARLIQSTLAPLCKSRRFDDPSEAFRRLTAATEVLAIQSGEPGPLAQAVAGLDIALWDLVARRARKPLYRMFREEEIGSVPAYASGLNADRPEILALRKHAEGYRRFKLKVGFGQERDVRNLRALREAFGPGTPIMVDANQAWTFEEAVEMSAALAPFGPVWLEEPLRADAPLSDWQRLTRGSPIPVALGENLRGDAAFRQMMESGGISVLQPDIGKWGGFSRCVAIGRRALEHGISLCPHWLGGGIGLMASLHFLAAVGGDGVLEVDSNPNPLRDRFILGFPDITSGNMRVPEGYGLGVAPDLDGLERYRVALPV